MMNSFQIREMQKKIGTVPDGFWGPKSIAACQSHLRKLMPKNNPWPGTSEAELRAFYGSPGDESNLVTFKPPYRMVYDRTPVSKIRCHKKVADSLERILTRVGANYGHDFAIIGAAGDYSGCYNYRTKRGGTSWSLHAWGAAIDLDADDNTFRDAWPVKADMPLEIMEEFALDGWVSAGAFWGYDAMHFQSTN